MKTRWRVIDSETIPVSVQCKEIGHPNLDSDGRTQYDNTHFDDEREAWAKCKANHRAWVRKLRENVKVHERRLVESRRDLALAYEAREVFTDAYEARFEADQS